MGKIEKEKETVSLMIRIFCKKHEGNVSLCAACREHENYAHERLDRCKYGEKKTSCKKCPAHWYTPLMLQRMCEVMRLSGPRMLMDAPIVAMRHLLVK